MILRGATSESDLGIEVAKSVFEAELKYCIENEFVQVGEDYLYRRTKMGLHLSDKDKQAVTRYIQSKA